jgi:hypothetical protein
MINFKSLKRLVDSKDIATVPIFSYFRQRQIYLGTNFANI